jgi:DNA modification methylase
VIELYNADCYEKLKEIPDGSVDLVIIDPPYQFNGKTGGGAFGPKKRDYHEEYRDLYKRTGKTEETERLRIKANKARASEDLAGIDTGFDYSALDLLDAKMKAINAYVWCSKAQLRDILAHYQDKKCSTDILTWHKTNPTPTCNNTYLSDTEYLVYAREKGVKLYGSYATKHKYYVTPANVADKKLYKHPTIKPLDIIKNLITNSSLRGGVVLDCFMGSGTTGVAAKELGRSFIGIEIDEKYYKIAEKRIAEATEATENEPILRNTNEEGKPSVQGEKKGLQEGQTLFDMRTYL